MTTLMRLSAVLVLAGFPFAFDVAAQHPAMPAGTTHDEHMAQIKKDAEVKQHGQMAMGFDQDKATHHFTLTASGGVIAVTANDEADLATRDQIRTHLREIAAAFGRGDFEKPLLTHGELPPGVSTMQRHKSEIAYTFETRERGGAVRMSTSSADALNAIHDFLRYQIREHATGDAVTAEVKSTGGDDPAPPVQLASHLSQ